MKTTAPKLLLLSAALCGLFTASAAKANVLLDMGAPKAYAVFTMPNGGGLVMSGTSSIYGPTGVDSMSGAMLQGNSTIYGDLFLEQGAPYSPSPGSGLDGSTGYGSGSFHQDGPTDTALTNEANALSSISLTLGGMPNAGTITSTNPSAYTIGKPNLVMQSTSTTLTLDPSNPNGQFVMSLKNFSLQTSTLTLVGTATQKLIVDISTGGIFTLQGSTVRLMDSGGHLYGNNLYTGLDPSNVVFNVLGSSANITTLQNSSLTGTILALNRTLGIRDGSTVTGAALGLTVAITNASKVVEAPVISQ